MVGPRTFWTPLVLRWPWPWRPWPKVKFSTLQDLSNVFRFYSSYLIVCALDRNKYVFHRTCFPQRSVGRYLSLQLLGAFNRWRSDSPAESDRLKVPVVPVVEGKPGYHICQSGRRGEGGEGVWGKVEWFYTEFSRAAEERRSICPVLLTTLQGNSSGAPVDSAKAPNIQQVSWEREIVIQEMNDGINMSERIKCLGIIR